MEGKVEHWEAWADLITRSWDDDALRARLLGEPAAVLREIGVELPEEVRVVTVESADEEVPNDGATLVLPVPARPVEGELSEEALEAVAGGAPSDSSSLIARIQPLTAPETWRSELQLP